MTPATAPPIIAGLLELGLEVGLGDGGPVGVGAWSFAKVVLGVGVEVVTVVPVVVLPVVVGVTLLGVVCEVVGEDVVLVLVVLLPVPGS